MPYEKLTKRDRNQLRLPFETVRICRPGSNQASINTAKAFIMGKFYIDFLIDSIIPYTGGGALILIASSFVSF